MGVKQTLHQSKSTFFISFAKIFSVKAYFISGLGADKRAFYKIKLPGNYEPVHLDWLKPLPNESFPEYAKRFSEIIKSGEDFILIGLSFGGMLASEIAKLIPPKKLIIISSVSCYNELPWYFKKAGRLGLHKMISPAVYKQATLLNRFMGAGDKEMKAIVYSYVNNIDPEFIRWSLNIIVNWEHIERLPNLIHIHGSKDHLLPRKYVKANYIIENGGHLMVMNKAEEINYILAAILNGD
jgi:pimeloyl-ACP methyl ester carboxylesterase